MKLWLKYGIWGCDFCMNLLVKHAAEQKENVHRSKLKKSILTQQENNQYTFFFFKIKL